LHCRPPLGALVLRHDQHQPIALHGGDHRQGDAGVAAGGFDQHIAGSNLPARLGVLDHAQRRPILDRTGGVVDLQLAENDVGGIARQAL
jgi:hypothetical protein